MDDNGYDISTFVPPDGAVDNTYNFESPMTDDSIHTADEVLESVPKAECAGIQTPLSPTSTISRYGTKSMGKKVAPKNCSGFPE